MLVYQFSRIYSEVSLRLIKIQSIILIFVSFLAWKKNYGQKNEPLYCPWLGCGGSFHDLFPTSNEKKAMPSSVSTHLSFFPFHWTNYWIVSLMIISVSILLQARQWTCGALMEKRACVMQARLVENPHQVLVNSDKLKDLIANWNTRRSSVKSGQSDPRRWNSVVVPIHSGQFHFSWTYQICKQTISEKFTSRLHKSAFYPVWLQM